MASDWAFYYLTQPLGIAAIAVAIGLAFILWRLLLGSSYRVVGSRPLLAGYTAALVALTAYTFVTSYFEFTRRVEIGALSESLRWTTVPGWTVYMTVLSLVVLLPVLFLVGTPTAALLTRLRRLTAANIVAVTIAAWLGLTVLVWLFPLNTWHLTHRLESFSLLLRESGPGVCVVGIAFYAAISYFATDKRAT
jgi:hypothetical protein